MFDDLFPIAVGIALLSFFIGPLLRRLGAGRRTAEAERLRVEAASRGLRYEAATREAVPGQSPAAAVAPFAAHVFSGSSAGLAWSASVEATLDADGDGPRRNRSQRTRITFPGLAAAPGTFLLIMALPPGAKLPPPAAPGSGFLAGLAARATEGLLDLYVTGYFGAEHRQLVNVAGAARPEAPPGLLVLSTDPSLAARLLDPQGAALLEALHQPEGTRAEQQARRGFGLLITPAGLLFGCQVALGDPAVLRGVAEQVARVATHARFARPPPLS